MFISARDIQNLEIISTEEAGAKEVQMQNKVTVKRPIAKRANRSVSECIPPSTPPSVSQNQNQNQNQVQNSVKKTTEQNYPEYPVNGRVVAGI